MNGAITWNGLQLITVTIALMTVHVLSCVLLATVIQITRDGVTQVNGVIKHTAAIVMMKRAAANQNVHLVSVILITINGVTLDIGLLLITAASVQLMQTVLKNVTSTVLATHHVINGVMQGSGQALACAASALTIRYVQNQNARQENVTIQDAVTADTGQPQTTAVTAKTKMSAANLSATLANAILITINGAMQVTGPPQAYAACALMMSPVETWNAQDSLAVTCNNIRCATEVTGQTSTSAVTAQTTRHAVNQTALTVSASQTLNGVTMVTGQYLNTAQATVQKQCAAAWNVLLTTNAASIHGATQVTGHM